MAVKKFAISVPEDVMDEVTEAATRQGVSRSYYIVQVLRRVASARKDAEISRRINALFEDPEVAAEQAKTARAFRRCTPDRGTEW
jgi:metal-responsive CopG/Arc/MetJ family transcriptional regulator